MMSATDVNLDFKRLYDRCVAGIDNALEGYLAHEPSVPQILHQSMLYSLRAGGKRLRPVMVIFSCKACGGQEITAMPAAAAIEMVHTYSLIHDDLPAMDNDDLRRGQPSNHKVFGDGIAILAGDGLLTYAFQTLAMHVPDSDLAIKLVSELAAAAGAGGMIGGQVADLLGGKNAGTTDEVDYIHIHKTAMMFRGATRMGAICAGADDRLIDVLGDYGLKLGLAFQIIDDLLDVTGSSQDMGKETQKDHKAGKLTYPAVVGVEASRRQADKLMEEAIAVLKPLGQAAEILRQLAGILINRKN